ncbi:MAG: chorismate synthase [Brevinematales bacterium]
MEYITAGESHGRGLSVIVKGIPSNLKIDPDFIDKELAARQSGYGRGSRMKIESDKADIISGVAGGVTNGAPINIIIWNKDYENWKGKVTEKVVRPRPGHADLIGSHKYGMTDDVRRVLERSSARETSARVAAGAVSRLFLKEFGIGIFSHVVNWGGIEVDTSGMTYEEIRTMAAGSEIRSACNSETLAKIKALIDGAKVSGDTIGGVIETIISPVPPFLGSYQTFGEKLDGRIAGTVLGLQAVKGIEFGLGFRYGSTHGKNAHDEIFYNDKTGKYYRKTNNAGGIEGGMTNGSPVVFRSVMKPIPTLMSPLMSVNIETKAPESASTERSDVSAVAACGTVIENIVAVDIANALIARYGGDSLELIKSNFENDPAIGMFAWR